MKRFSILLTLVTALLLAQQISFAQEDASLDLTDSTYTGERVSLFDSNQHQVTYQDSTEDVQSILNSVTQSQDVSYHTNYVSNASGGKSCCDPSCPAFWEHRDHFFGEYLYLTVRGANVPYATHVDGVGPNEVPIGPVVVADPDYQGGFRVGGGMALDSCSSLTFNYSFFESSHGSAAVLPGGTGLFRAELVHPNTTNVASDSLSTRALYDIDFDMVDINYKSLIWGGDCYSLNYLLGFRYGHTRQDLLVRYDIVGATTVETEIDFDGFGPRIGLEGERSIGRGLLVYFRTNANFLVGEFTADYQQNNIAAGLQAATSYDDDRIVSLLELELGLGWQSCCGKYRLAAGYYVGAWFNSVTTPNWIDAVQRNDYITEMSDTLTFDGLTARAEIRF
ncbi:MAG: hypothetical protein IH899_14220 [Planctomycetes bacterium]|nr:hypothetical protein [Planctomycetota bacterium]